MSNAHTDDSDYTINFFGEEYAVIKIKEETDSQILFTGTYVDCLRFKDKLENSNVDLDLSL